MLYRRGNIWWTKFQHRGQPVYLSTGEAAHAAATKEARRLRYEFEQKAGPGGRTVGVTIAAIEELDIIRAQQEHLGARREETLRGVWRHVVGVFGELRDVNTLSVSDLDAYEGKRRSQGARGQTIRRETQSLVRALRLAKREGLISRLPFDPEDMRKIRTDPKDQRYTGKAWDLAEINKIFSSLSVKAKTANYEQLLRLMMGTGLRIEEFRRINPSWLRPGPVLVVPQESSKTGGTRTLPLTDEMATTVRELFPLDYAWKPNKSLKLASQTAGFDRVLTPRDLRKWFLTQAAKFDPLAAQRLAGHTNIATTGIYVESGGDDALRVGKNVLKVVTGGGDSESSDSKNQVKSRAPVAHLDRAPAF